VPCWVWFIWWKRGIWINKISYYKIIRGQIRNNFVAEFP
jgi:hypothetical protein